MVDPPPLVRPVAGPVASRFAYDRAAPFRRGARRIVRFRVSPGTPVRAPCSGRVSHAGATPGGPAVAVRCGAWSVTLTGAAPAGVRRGQRVRPGARVGRSGGTAVGLGLRRAADPFGYVDPLPLLADPAPAHRFAPLGPAPRARPAVPSPTAVPRRAPVPVHAPHGRPAPALVPLGAPSPGAESSRLPTTAAVPDPGGRGAPVLAWVGLAVVALGLPVGAVGLRRRSRAVATRAAAARAAMR